MCISVITEGNKVLEFLQLIHNIFRIIYVPYSFLRVLLIFFYVSFNYKHTTPAVETDVSQLMFSALHCPLLASGMIRSKKYYIWQSTLPSMQLSVLSLCTLCSGLPYHSNCIIQYKKKRVRTIFGSSAKERFGIVNAEPSDPTARSHFLII
jgi:hypothetical protein